MFIVDFGRMKMTFFRRDEHTKEECNFFFVLSISNIHTIFSMRVFIYQKTSEDKNSWQRNNENVSLSGLPRFALKKIAHRENMKVYHLLVTKSMLINNHNEAHSSHVN